ncbi:uncharacterized protein BX663DRAFT_544776 [Cokeromyces recurvatus]|uniref:uncharacterized protein n=1 Tax=Cokeromyces recurvatus TaxID=90255 RepID=UPI00221EAF2F|nr:uncharacterized protein BX663DRAFT_544776 [Cokeromyces recurvatus]KAI7900616.1 hypothetical protein BX663DRAFT_544776 [Cokeromyces recurvatus]
MICQNKSDNNKLFEMAQQQSLQSKANHFHHYRPIAPSLTPPKILPRPEIFDTEKRKWDSAFDDLDNYNIKTEQRRHSGSSQGSNTSLATEQRLRRKEQNRAAQRAFRERKERYVKELEEKIKEMEAKYTAQIAQLTKENEELRQAMIKIKEEPLLKENEKQENLTETKSLSLSSPSSSSSPPPSQPISTHSSPVVEKKMTPVISSSAVACIRDKNGVSFCERLKKEVCSNAYEQLLTEPLFDSQGYLNETVVSHPVPIVTTTPKREEADVFSELEKSLSEIFSSSSATNRMQDDASLTDSTKLISCAEIWNAIAEHPQFDEFDTDILCDELRRRAKCSKTGPVFEEHEIQEVIDMMLEIINLNKTKESNKRNSSSSA